MILDLYRRPSTRDATEGALFMFGERFCATLEPASPIPAGEYAVTLYHSPRAGETVALLHDVPGHEFIEIHVGNSSKDTKLCILVGDDGGRDDDNWIGRSRHAFDRLIQRIRGALVVSAVSIRVHDASVTV